MKKHTKYSKTKCNESKIALLNSSWLMSDSEVCSRCNQDRLLASGRGVNNMLALS